MFKKYPSIENHYREKIINEMVIKYPETVESSFKWFIQEKLHGANTQFEFTSEGEFRIHSRNQLVSKASNSHYGIWQWVAESDWEDLVPVLAEYARKNDICINVYGEYFGGKIQKGVDYGIDKRFLVFDVVIDGKFLAMEELYECEIISGIRFPTILGWIWPGSIYDAIKDVAERQIHTNSLYGSPVKYEPGENLMEGMVIKPYDKVLLDRNGSPFYFKVKNDKFKEKQKAAKIPIQLSDEVLYFRNEFEAYLTENRINSIFSKYGKIESKSDLGKYLSLVMQDAKEDFYKDHEITLDSKDEKVIFRSAGKILVPMLMKEI